MLQKLKAAVAVAGKVVFVPQNKEGRKTLGCAPLHNGSSSHLKQRDRTRVVLYVFD